MYGECIYSRHLFSFLDDAARPAATSAVSAALTAFASLCGMRSREARGAGLHTGDADLHTAAHSSGAGASGLHSGAAGLHSGAAGLHTGFAELAPDWLGRRRSSLDSGMSCIRISFSSYHIPNTSQHKLGLTP